MATSKSGRHKKHHRSSKFPPFEETGLEEQFILRLHEEDAGSLRKLLDKNSKKFGKNVKLDMNPETHYGQIDINNKTIPLKLVDLPTVVESSKTIDKKTFYKTANIHQMIVPYDPEEEEKKNENTQEKDYKKFLHPHGVTPPLRNVRACRFRKKIKNPHHMELNLDDPEVEKELRWLLRMDSEAIAVRCDLVMEEKKPAQNVEAQDSEDHYVIDEKDVFGSIISDSYDSDDGQDSIKFQVKNEKCDGEESD